MIDLHPEILSTNGEPQFAVLPYAEFLQVKAALARLIYLVDTNEVSYFFRRDSRAAA